MKVVIRKWDTEGKTFEEVARLPIDSYNGVSFLTRGSPATTNFNNLRVRDVYLHAVEPNTLVVYTEEREED